MKAAIITEDKFFTNATEMYDFLTGHFKDDSNKSYFIIDENSDASKRKNKSKRAEHPIAGSSKMHLIAVSCTGDWLTKVVLKPTDEQLMDL